MTKKHCRCDFKVEALPLVFEVGKSMKRGRWGGGGRSEPFIPLPVCRYDAGRRAHCLKLQTHTPYIAASPGCLYLSPPATEERVTF